MYIKLYCITTAFQIPCDELKLWIKYHGKTAFFKLCFQAKYNFYIVKNIIVR